MQDLYKIGTIEVHSVCHRSLELWCNKGAVKVEHNCCIKLVQLMCNNDANDESKIDANSVHYMSLNPNGTIKVQNKMPAFTHPISTPK